MSATNSNNHTFFHIRNSQYLFVSHFDQRDGRELARIEQEMIDNKITTRITDPINGEDNLLGYIRSEKDPVTGYADGDLVSVEEMLEYNDG